MTWEILFQNGLYDVTDHVHMNIARQINGAPTQVFRLLSLGTLPVTLSLGGCFNLYNTLRKSGKGALLKNLCKETFFFLNQ